MQADIGDLSGELLCELTSTIINMLFHGHIRPAMGMSTCIRKVHIGKQIFECHKGYLYQAHHGKLL